MKTWTIVREILFSQSAKVSRLIESLLYPLFDINDAFSLVDSILHGLVEQNPPLTALKFLRYNPLRDRWRIDR